MTNKNEPLSVDDKFELLLTALTANKTPGIDLEALRTIIGETQQSTAKAMQKAMRPENEAHPGISAFSRPKGDVADPKAALLYEFWYNAYPCHLFPETEHWRELELMTQVRPGEYTVLRKDGSKMAVAVKGERDADQKLTKVLVEFPVSRDEKWLVPPKSVVVYQLVYNDHPRRRFLEAMQEHLMLTMGDLDAVEA